MLGTTDKEELRQKINELKRPEEEGGDPEYLYSVLSQLENKELHEVIYDEYIWLESHQALAIKDWPESIIMMLGGRGSGKLLSKDTSILTEKGWKTIGTIEIGDKVYDETGNICNVENYFEPEPEKVYELEFDTGEKFLADADHLWTTWTHHERKCWNRNVGGPYPKNWHSWKWSYKDRWGNFRKSTGPQTRTTQEIVDTFRHGKRGDLNHSIPTCFPLNIEKKEVPVDSYLLGVWIGDGHKDSAIVTTEDTEIIDYFESIGVTCYKTTDAGRAASYSIGACKATPDPEWGMLKSNGSLHSKFASLDLINNKHIPELYINNSEEVRLNLLRGLMDSDGYIDPERGLVEFMQTDKSIAEAVHFLACSFGEKVTIHEGRATLYGKDCGPKYRVCWRPNQVNPFWLQRKYNVAQKSIDSDTNQKTRTRQRMIVSYKEVKKPSCGMRCLTVDSPSNLFLVGKSLIPTHNTTLGVQWLRNHYKNGIKGEIALMAPTSSEVRDVVVFGGFLKICDPEDDMPEFESSKSRIVFPDGTVARMFSAERGNERVRGSNNEFVWFDELGSVPDKDVLDQLMLTLRVGKSKCLITTTPRNTEAIRDLYSRAVFNDEEPKEDKDVRIITASTYDNQHNLSKAFRNQVISSYENTRLGEQELQGRLLFEAEHALWSIDLISRQTLKNGWNRLPDLKRVAIGIDPAVSQKKNSDLTGIVVSALGEDDNAYVLQDESGRYSPQAWCQKVIELFHHYSNFAPTSAVVERNMGGQIVGDMIRREKPLMPLDEVFHTQDKLSRAQPVSMNYEKGLVWHVQSFNELEGEMSSYEGKPGEKSPDRMDSLVMSLTHLIAGTRRVTKVSDLVL